MYGFVCRWTEIRRLSTTVCENETEGPFEVSCEPLGTPARDTGVPLVSEVDGSFDVRCFPEVCS